VKPFHDAAIAPLVFLVALALPRFGAIRDARKIRGESDGTIFAIVVADAHRPPDVKIGSKSEIFPLATSQDAMPRGVGLIHAGFLESGCV
jgi:hypothetical protein